MIVYEGGTALCTAEGCAAAERLKQKSATPEAPESTR